MSLVGSQTHVQLQSWLSSRYPDAEPLVVGDLQQSGGGYSNVTLFGAVGWNNPPWPRTVGIVVRLQPDFDSVYPDCDISRQYRVMEALQGSDIPVPQLLGYESDPAVLGSKFFVMQQIAGQVPNENPLYHLSGWFHDQSSTLQRQHWFAGLSAIARIARVDWRARGLGFLRADQSHSPIAQQLHYYREAIDWAERLGRPYPHLYTPYEWLLSHQPTDEPLVLSWGDAKLGNCVFDGDALAAVLDWEQATLASPVDDLAWWLMLDESLSIGYGVPRLPALPTREESIRYWEEQSAFNAANLQYYEVFAAWRMAYVMARIGTVFKQRGWINPNDDMDIRNGGSVLLALHGKRLGLWG